MSQLMSLVSVRERSRAVTRSLEVKLRRRFPSSRDGRTVSVRKETARLTRPRAQFSGVYCNRCGGPSPKVVTVDATDVRGTVPRK